MLIANLIDFTDYENNKKFVLVHFQKEAFLKKQSGDSKGPKRGGHKD